MRIPVVAAWYSTQLFIPERSDCTRIVVGTEEGSKDTKDSETRRDSGLILADFPEMVCGR